MFRRAFVLLLITLALAACEGAGQQQTALHAPAFPGGAGSGAGRRVAILLPLTGPRGDIGQSMLKAAKLALDAPGAPTLDAKDTAGTAEGAATAAREAIAAGASLILGPLTSAETASVAPIAKRASVPILAFTNDPSQARPGVWTLGITPLQQVSRLVSAARAEGKSNFAGLLPDNDFGRVMSVSLQEATASAGLPPPVIRQYASGMNSISAAMRDLSDYANRGALVDARIKAARAQGDEEGKRMAADLQRNRNVPPPPFDALLLADTGQGLTEISSVMPYYDVSRESVRVLGPALWAAPASGSGQFPGAWFAAPDPSARAAYDQAYTARYGAPAPLITDLAFDAASVARVLAADGGFTMAALTQPTGYAGVDGVFLLLPDGHVRRGLAVFEVRPGGPVIVEQAPQSLASPGA